MKATCDAVTGRSWIGIVGFMVGLLVWGTPVHAQMEPTITIDRIVVIADGVRRDTILRVRARTAIDSLVLLRLSADISAQPFAGDALIRALDADALPGVERREVLVWSSPTPTAAPQPTQRGTVVVAGSEVQLTQLAAGETLAVMISEPDGVAVLPTGLDAATLARATIDILAPQHVAAEGLDLRYAAPLSAAAAGLLPAPAATALLHTRLRVGEGGQIGVLRSNTSTTAFRAQDIEPVYVDGRRSYLRITIAVLVATIASSLAFGLSIGFRRRIDRIGGDKH